MNRTVLMDWNKENKDYTGNTRQECNSFLFKKKWNNFVHPEIVSDYDAADIILFWNSTRPGPTLMFNLLSVLID